ncbi:hypothetical protein OHC33_000637 [Knufia fluminis]|uniref:Uncharacterized protein n=1 Tax=Knufia fluminis TaxID=191047 RepID=A0AAN8EM65_9EURO|nr:hypothetical protein OHC33_000637 [Knufia fluminis]
MATTCVAQPGRDARESVYCRPRILKSTTGWAERVQFQSSTSEVRIAGTYHVGGRRDAVHTANSIPPTRPPPTTLNIHNYPDTYQRVSVLVADLLQSIAQSPSAYGSSPPACSDDELPTAYSDDEPVARAYITSHSTAPCIDTRRKRSSDSTSRTSMDFNVDFGSSSGFKSHAKKKKAAAAAKFDPWADNNEEKKDDAGANGAGGDGGNGGADGGDASGAGGGGDDNNGGGNDDDDDWGFSTGKKNKKKSKKKQEEEEEEERKRKEEEEAAAAATGNADPLSWADDTNGEAANEDWTMSWGGPKKKDKKKKGDAPPAVPDAPPAVPDAPPATDAFQDIDLDGSAPKLDFSFDGMGDTKKSQSGGGGFSNWGKSWDFDAVGKTEEKKEEASDFGSNNPWGFGGSKTKKKTTAMSNFDFGDFGTSNNNDDLNFGAGEDVGDTKAADDAWGFGSTGKKDKKKKGAIEEITEDPPAEPEEKEEDNWGGWGGAKKTTKSKKKNAFDDAFAGTTETDTAAEPSFDWGFGKDKTEDKPAAKEEEGDDWMSGAWGATGKKKNKKKTEDLTASIDLTSNADAKTTASDPPADDGWGFSTGKKDKKKGKKGFLDDEPPPLPEVPEPPPAAEPEFKEPLVAWDFGLNTKDKKKKQKQMQLEGSWADRVTQEMVDAAEAEAAAAAVEPEPIPDPEPALDQEPEFEPVPPPPLLEEKVAWDHGLTAKDKRKKQKEMTLAGTWDSRVTQEDIDAEKAAAEAAAAAVIVDPEPEAVVVVGEAEADSTPLEELEPWDYMLTSKEKKKKEKELRANGGWDDRLTQDKINQMIYDRDNAAVAPEEEAAPEPEPEPIPEPEPEIVIEAEPAIPLEDLVPWDHGLTGVKKRKKEKDMRMDGTWDDRLTQDKINQMFADRDAAAAAAAPADEPEPIPEPEPEPEPEQVAAPEAPVESLEELERQVPWDHNLSTKDKKKKQKQMQLEGTWDSRLTQEIIDDKIAAARAVAEANVEPEPELIPDPEPEPAPVVEERFPWDHGLSKVEKKRKEKSMKADGTWEDRLTQEKIDEEAFAAATAAAEPEPEPEPEPESVLEEPAPEPEPDLRVPWDFGLSTKDKKKKEKSMKLDGSWDNRVTQEQIDEDEAAKAAAVAEPEPEPIPEPEPVAEEPVDNSWGFGGWGASKTKSKKKSLLDPEPEKTEEKADDGWGGGWGFGLGKDKKKKATTPVVEEPEPIPEPEPEPDQEEKVDDIWSFGATTKDKKKKDKSAKKSDLFDHPAEDPVPEPPPAPAADGDMWASFSKPEKKTTKKGKKGVEELPPPAPTPPALGLTPEPEMEPEALPSVDDFSWGGLDTGRKSNKSLTEEAPAKKSSSSMWGFGSSSSTAKTKKEKEKEAKAKKEEEERLQREAEEAEAAEAAKAAEAAEAEAEAERLAAEEAAKPSKKTKGGKLTKTSSKSDEKKKSDDLLDLLDEPVPTPASSSSKLKKTSTRGSDRKLEELPEEEDKPQTDYFGFWGGSSKKTAGKKSTDDKKEIKTSALTNEEDALLAELNEDEIQAILDDAPAPSSPKLTKNMSNGKTKAKSSIADRLKAFEPKEDAGKKSKSTSAALIIEEAEAEAETALTPKEAKKAAKGKTSAKSSKSKVDQPPSPPPAEEQKRSKDSIPGGFPGAFGDDDDLLADEPLVPEPEPEPASAKAKKSSKVEKKSSKAASSKKKTLAFEDPVETVAEPEPFTDDIDLLGEPAKLPTPPPEDGKKSKKERPRVERSATTSWGFWGASAPTPKKPVRSRTADDISPPVAKKAKSPPALTRSKSTKSSKSKAAEEVRDEKSSKTSGSDKEGSGKTSDRPKPSRGMSFTSFMMGSAPPSAMRNGGALKRSNTTGSRSSSRRQSMVDSGLLSPPPEDENPITSKAAKLMGFASGTPKRRSSTKQKSKAYVDPYPIDDDDMVMINATDKEARTPRSKPKNKIVTSTQRSSTKPRSKTISGDEDVVMVDSPLGMDSANEDFERPQLQRSNTGRKSFFGSFFGSGSRTPAENPRSTPATDNEDTAPRPPRSRGTSRRHSRVMSPADGFTTDAPAETDADVAAREAKRRAKRAAAKQAEEDERLAREQRRRERREREKADLEARRERAREQARKDREAEEQRKGERRARRREKEEAERARLAQEEAGFEAAAERRKEERRRLREQLEAEAAVNPLTKDDRHRTYAGEEETRTRRKGDRTKSRTKESSGRRSTALMAEYHESRSGSGRGIKPPENKTSSWIDSQKDEPPELPPVEPTVLDESGQVPRPVDDAESGSRRRRKDKYAGVTEDEIAMARAKRRERKIIEKEKSTSGGSDEKMQKRSSKRHSKIVEDDFYANNDPVRTFDGRPQQTKRSSFLGKFF